MPNCVMPLKDIYAQIPENSGYVNWEKEFCKCNQGYGP